MRIRSQLAWLMLAVIAPVALLAGLALRGWYDTQQQLNTQRHLERVRALRLALDTELQGSLRTLRAFADRPQLLGDAVPDAPALRRELQRLLDRNPRWSSIVVVERDASRSAMALADDAQRSEPPAGARAFAQRVAASGVAQISGLIDHADGSVYGTFAAVPVLRDGQVQRVLLVGVKSVSWLDFLRRFPLEPDATLTLSDASGRVIARTLHHERWVGQPPLPQFWARVQQRPEGALLTTGLDGQPFHAAYSRLDSVDWTLATGVPAREVEAPLRRQALLMALGVLLAALLATALALLLGRRITRAFGALSQLLPMSDAQRELAVRRPLPLAEADDVRRLLDDTLQAKGRALQAAEAARAHAEHSADVKDEFVAMLAHELRNPLSAMAASVSLLESPRATPQALAQASAVLRRQVDLATRLVDDLLDSARLNAGKIALQRDAVDLAAVVRDAAHALGDACKSRGIELALRLEPLLVHGDALRLEQVVVNLLHNAVKFSRSGGHIGVELGRGADGMALLCVGDDGIGIPAELLPQVFEPYVQATPNVDRARCGLGLGLHLVQRLVALHGGSVYAHSDGEGRGARFEVRLPLHDAVPSATPPRAAAPPLPPLRVVVVEDNVDAGDAVARLLRSAGHEVLVATRGDDGLALLRLEPSDVALIDLGLPGLNGFELVRGLRARPGAAAQAVLLALTAYADAATREQARQAGFDGLMQKPFDAKRFDAELHRLGVGRPPQRDAQAAGETAA